MNTATDNGMSKLVAGLRYYSAHAAAFGGLAAGLACLASKDLPGAVTAFGIALAGFGFPIKPL